MRALIADASPATAWRWGDFLLQPSQRRLLRAGVPVELEDRAFDLIVLLLEHRERTLDRQEIITAIWGKRPVSDATLRQLVYKARRAIGDDGDQQLVIHTLYGRSLQWVAPVELVFESGDDSGAPIAAAEPGRNEIGPAVGAGSHSFRWRAAGAIAVLALCAAGGIGLYARMARESDTLPPLPRMAIEPIRNATGDTSLDWIINGLPGLLGSLVAQHGDLDVVSSQRVAQASRFKPTRGRTHQQQVRFATGADFLVTGSLRRLTEKLYELDLRVENSAGHSDITITGAQPAMLGVNAIERLRVAVGGHDGESSANIPELRDPFLVEAFVRGNDLQSRGVVADARSFYQICVRSKPDFLPARLQLGITQSLADNGIVESEQTFKDLLAQAERQNDLRMAGQALLWLGRLAHGNTQENAALDYFHRALPYARQARDLEGEIEIHLLSAITAHTAGKEQLAKDELTAGKVLLADHPNLRRARNILSDAQDFIALENGDAKAALAAAQEGLRAREEEGDERDVVVSLTNIAVALSAMDRMQDSMVVLARAWQRARAGHYLELEYSAAGNLALDMLNTGLTQSAVLTSAAMEQMGRQQDSAASQVMAMQIGAAAQLEQDDAVAALATLRRADALADIGQLGDEVFLNQQLYEALAMFLAEPSGLSDLQKRTDGFVAADKGIRDELRKRQVLVQALNAAAQDREPQALSLLRRATMLKGLSQDGDIELRMAPLLIALHNHDGQAAAIALKGYDAVHTPDAALLPLYMKWVQANGDNVSGQRARAHLEQLRQTGLQALVASRMDPDHPAD